MPDHSIRPFSTVPTFSSQSESPPISQTKMGSTTTDNYRPVVDLSHELQMRGGEARAPTSSLGQVVSFSSSVDSFLAAQKGSAIEQSKTFSQEVLDLYELARSIAGDKNGKEAVRQLGETAQKYVQGKLKDEALRGVLQQVGVTEEQAAVLQPKDILDAGYDYLVSGFSKNAFFESLGKTATTRAAMQVETSAVETTPVLSASAGKIFGAVGAAYAAYELFSNWGSVDPATGALHGATVGATVGSYILPGVGTAVGGVLGGIIGGVNGFFGGNKSGDQQARDQVRAFMKERGILDVDWGLHLANGTTFDIGRDGGAMMVGVDGTQHRVYEPDFSNPLAHEAVGMANSLSALLTGGDAKLTAAFAGYFANAAMIGATSPQEVKTNLQAIFSKFALSQEQALGGIVGLVQQGQVSEQVGIAYMNGFQSIFSK